MAYHTAQCAIAGAANQHRWVRALHGARVRMNWLELIVFAVKGDFAAARDAFEYLNVFIGDLAAIGKRQGGERVEFLFKPTDTGAENHATF